MKNAASVRIRDHDVKFSHGLSAFAHRHSRAIKPALASIRLGASRQGSRRGLPVSIRDDSGLEKFHLLVEKDRYGKISVSMNREELKQNKAAFSTLWKRGGVFIDLLTDPAIEPGVYPCDMSDAASKEGRVLAFCSNRPDDVLVPDRGFYLGGGYARTRKDAATAPAWEERNGEILWRGGPTGVGLKFTESMQVDDQDLIQRARMCLAARNVPGADIKFAVTSRYSEDVADAYKNAGIAGGFIPPAEWSSRKFAIDIDGYSNAFSNYYTRMLMGCCVIKVASPFGFKQWYYDELEPWKHYVPVAADLSDLAERIVWSQNNDRECKEIAAAAQQFAFSKTPDTERPVTVQRILSAYGS